MKSDNVTGLLYPSVRTQKALLVFNLKLVFDVQDYALKVITETNESWAKLVKRSISAGELSLV